MEYVESIVQAKAFISRISKKNHTAAHNCWAYVVGEKGDVFHSSDAGEPSGTAGKPMLNILQKHGMTNIAVVVTRYFGGIKLGVRGLIDAYSKSVSQTIELKKLKKRVQTITVCIEVSYEFNDTLQNLIKNVNFGIQKTDYSDKVVHLFEFERKHFKKLDKLFSEYQSRGFLKFSVIE